jgi:hypothetical protein
MRYLPLRKDDSLIEWMLSCHLRQRITSNQMTETYGHKGISE